MTLVTPVRLRLPLAVLLCGLLAALGVLVGAVPAEAAGTTAAGTTQAVQHVVHLKEAGPTLPAEPVYTGDTVVFVNDESPAIPPVTPTPDPVQRPSHQIDAASGPGSQDYHSGLLQPGETSPPTKAFALAGTYSYTDQRTELVSATPAPPKPVHLVVRERPKPTSTSGSGAGSSAGGSSSTSSTAGASDRASATPSAPPSVTSSPEPSKAPDAASARNAPGGAPSPQPTGGTGLALQPDLGNQPLGLGGSPAAGGPAPAVAPPVQDPALLLSQGSGAVQPAASTSLSGPDTGRRYGIPVVLALVALLGVSSLVVRVLLAEPLDRLPTGR